jgi:uncharacterized membrane protein
LLKAIILIFLIALATAFILNEKDVSPVLSSASSPNFLFFLVAFSSGIVAAFSWVKQDSKSTLPAVAVAVSLVPPLASVGIALSLLERDAISGSILLFLINLLGIILASTIVFSLYGFSSLQQWQEKKIEEEKEEEEEKHEEIEKIRERQNGAKDAKAHG